ncbi:hypothetical protein MRX96_028606 [Rhipicephalus microplus]
MSVTSCKFLATSNTQGQRAAVHFWRDCRVQIKRKTLLRAGLKPRVRSDGSQARWQEGGPAFARRCVIRAAASLPGTALSTGGGRLSDETGLRPVRAESRGAVTGPRRGRIAYVGHVPHAERTRSLTDTPH